jgi:hypothetical protein
VNDITQSNYMANKTTAETLYATDPVAYSKYTSNILEAFNSYWTSSFSDSSTATWTPVYRAIYASNQTNQLYINTYLAGNTTAQAFAIAVTNTFTLQDYPNKQSNNQ